MVLFFQELIVVNLFGEFLLEFVEFFGEGLDAILQEHFLCLGLTVGVDKAF